jgi:hypothetical protein
LKLDVEGAELEAIEGVRQLDNVDTITGEVHLDLLEAGVDAFFERLTAFEVERLSESDHAIGFVARSSQALPPLIDRSGRVGVTMPHA